jgi:hypothetical protein
LALVLSFRQIYTQQNLSGFRPNNGQGLGPDSPIHQEVHHDEGKHPGGFP